MGKMRDKNGNEISKDFCLESEWRYFPSVERSRKCIPANTHLTDKVQFDNYTFNNCRLGFLFEDIAYLIVKNDTDSLVLFDMIDKMYGDFSDVKDLNLLKAKVISLESVSRDF